MRRRFLIVGLVGGALGLFALALIFAVVNVRSPAPAQPRLLAAAAAYPPPSTERDKASFFIGCTTGHQAQVDPVVAPGPPGTLSEHMHDFFGNRSTASDSTYTSMIAAGTTCKHPGDTAGYWTPSLKRPNGTFVKPKSFQFYYRNQPYRYGTTRAFPADFRMIASPIYPFAYWNCAGEDKDFVRHSVIPSCGTKDIKEGLQFPNCWDGVSLDSADHRSHVVYPTGADAFFQTKGVCPSSHPVKLPMIQLHVIFGPIGNPAGYQLSDGKELAHGDFWNTWQQPVLEQLVRDCLQSGKSCPKFS